MYFDSWKGMNSNVSNIGSCNYQVERATLKIRLQKETEYELEILGDKYVLNGSDPSTHLAPTVT